MRICIKISYSLLVSPNIKLNCLQEKVFGSKFVTVCVTGNMENEIHMEGYQVRYAKYIRN